MLILAELLPLMATVALPPALMPPLFRLPIQTLPPLLICSVPWLAPPMARLPLPLVIVTLPLSPPTDAVPPSA